MFPSLHVLGDSHFLGDATVDLLMLLSLQELP